MTLEPTRLVPLAEVLARHHPTRGMTVSMGVTCECGYWTGSEVAGKTRPVGVRGDQLDWHRAEVIAALLAQPDPAPERPSEPTADEHDFTIPTHQGRACAKCGVLSWDWSGEPCRAPADQPQPTAAPDYDTCDGTDNCCGRSTRNWQPDPAPKDGE